jgi:hypothetical protein
MELRASDADREQAVERLRTAAMEGRLDSEELEQRIQTAYGSTFCSELGRLTADVTPPATWAPAPTPARPTFVATTPATNGFAIASLVCAVAWFMWFGSVLGVVFGHVALRQIRQGGGVQRGRGLAIAGLVLGYLSLAFFGVAMVAAFLGA